MAVKASLLLILSSVAPAVAGAAAGDPVRPDPVPAILEDLHLGSLTDLFAEHKINEKTLRMLSSEHLEEMGVNTGDRLRLLAYLKKESKTAPVGVSTTKATAFIQAIVERNNKVLMEQMTRLVEAKVAPLREQLQQQQAPIPDGTGLQQERRLQTDSCSSGTAAQNANVQKASLWLRGNGDEGGHIVMGNDADVNLFRGAAWTLRTDSNMTIAGDAAVGGKVEAGAGVVVTSGDINVLAGGKVSASQFCAGGTCTSSLGGPFVQNGANVGLGTSSAAAKMHIEGGHLLVSKDANTFLEVRGDATTPHIKFQQASNAAGTVLGSISAANRYFAHDTPLVSIELRSVSGEYVHGGAELAFLTKRQAYGHDLTTKMLIANNGNVGVGTTSPVSKLHVNGAIRSSTGACAAGDVDNGDGTCTATLSPFFDGDTRLSNVEHTFQQMRSDSSANAGSTDEQGMYAGYSMHSSNSKYSDLWRSMLMFDVSGLPSSAKIQSATLSFVVASANFKNDFGDALSLVSAFPASNYDITASARQTFAEHLLFSDRTRFIAQLQPGSSFLCSALYFLDRTSTSSETSGSPLTCPWTAWPTTTRPARRLPSTRPASTTSARATTPCSAFARRRSSTTRRRDGSRRTRTPVPTS